ncbi:hypothetical protein EVAR_41351_1 [Eumeta japonica]|uniref:Uncharacterized protein n=1 Tax=Eumeta variegata TaxID=151549 RepID=A0A4C1XLZ1_EUMVA|nr:hypothetical protein EVAR_41351_1 [Eumeta japonica]
MSFLDSYLNRLLLLFFKSLLEGLIEFNALKQRQTSKACRLFAALPFDNRRHSACSLTSFREYETTPERIKEKSTIDVILYNSIESLVVRRSLSNGQVALKVSYELTNPRSGFVRPPAAGGEGGARGGGALLYDNDSHCPLRLSDRTVFFLHEKGAFRRL